jgi:putative ABC transport system permease protein
MNFAENVRIALRALAANKLRSALTMLGIIIGVGAVVALMAIGTGATASITQQVQGIGSNVVVVFPGKFQRGRDTTSRSAFMYYTDYEALLKNLQGITGIVASYQIAGETVTYGKTIVTPSIVATTPSYSQVRSASVAHGRFITEGDRSTRARVAVIGPTTASNLFAGLNPVGRTIQIGGVPFEIVGLLTAKGASGFGNGDDIVILPLETAYDRLLGAKAVANGKRELTDISMSAVTGDAVNDVMVQTERIMRHEHGLKLTDDLDFTVLSQAQFLSALTAITATLTVFLGAIAGISLLVGGIGIMNIMLVSVTERTREIGLRKAVGARQSIILIQFLVETLVLSITGGMVGVALGWGIAALLSAAKVIQAQVTPSSVALAFIFSAAVGVFFGIYPAYRAARLRPIDALRYE